MDTNEIRDFLKNDPDGQALFAELTDGLKGNRDRILTEKKSLQEQLNDLSGQLETITDQLNRERQRSNELTAQKAINSEFDRYNVPRDVRPILEKHFSGLEGLQIDDSGTVNVGETALSEYMDSFFMSEAGKRFTTVRSAGSGSSGSYGTTPNSEEQNFREALSKSLRN